MLYRSRYCLRLKLKLIFLLVLHAIVVTLFFYYESSLSESINKELVFFVVTAIPVIGIAITFSNLKQVFIFKSGIIIRPIQLTNYSSTVQEIKFKDIKNVVSSKNIVTIYHHSGEEKSIDLSDLYFLDADNKRHDFKNNELIQLINEGKKQSGEISGDFKLPSDVKNNWLWHISLFVILAFCLLGVLYISILNNEGSLKVFLDNYKLIYN